jgi:hypothetical protein
MTKMADDEVVGAAAPDWYEDPMGRHQYRFWDGAAWTPDVADAGVASVDPLDGSGVAVAVGTEGGEPGGERELLVLPMSTDVTWGGFMTLHLTDGRLVVEKVMSGATGAMAVMAGGIAGVAIATDHARGKSQQAAGRYGTPDDILRASAANYAIDYAAITALRLTKKAMPIGSSRCKIASRPKNVLLAFKREYFDEVARVLREALGDRVVVK